MMVLGLPDLQLVKDFLGGMRMTVADHDAAHLG
jgi:hypothetical protein